MTALMMKIQNRPMKTKLSASQTNTSLMMKTKAKMSLSIRRVNKKIALNTKTQNMATRRSGKIVQTMTMSEIHMCRNFDVKLYI